MFDELIKSFKASLYERMSSPFLSSLIVFFVYFNWKAILVIFFGTNSIVERIHFVEASYASVHKNISLPVIFAVATSLIYPFVSVVFFAAQNIATVLKRSLRNLIEKNATVTVEKFIELKTEMQSAKDECNVLLSAKDDESKSLRSRVESLSGINENLQAKVDRLEGRCGKQLGIKAEKYDEFCEETNSIAHSFGEQLKRDGLQTVYAIWNSYGSGIEEIMSKNGRALHEHQTSFGVLESWFSAMASRIGNGNLQEIIDEFSGFLQLLVRVSESVRIDIKTALDMNGADDLRIAAGRPDTIKEQWNQVRDNVNNLISRWESLLLECVSDKKYNIRPHYIGRLYTIGDPVSSYASQ